MTKLTGFAVDVVDRVDIVYKVDRVYTVDKVSHCFQCIANSYSLL